MKNWFHGGVGSTVRTYLGHGIAHGQIQFFSHGSELIALIEQEGCLGFFYLRRHVV
jgi:hypothetical protein